MAERVNRGFGDDRSARGSAAAGALLRDERAASRACVRTAAVLALVLLVYGMGLSSRWRIGMDQALYTSIARSIATGQGYAFSGRTQASIPPVTPLYLAAAWGLGHRLQPGISFLETGIYFNAFMLAAGLAGLAAAFFLIRETVSGALGRPRRPIDLSPGALVLTAFALVAFSGRYYQLSMETMTDVPYCVVSWAALLFLLMTRRQPRDPSPARATTFAAAFFLALAPLVRVASIVLVVSVAALLVCDAVRAGGRRRETVRALAVAGPALVALTLMLLSILLGRGSGAFNYLPDSRTLGGCLAAFPSNLAQVPARLFGVFFRAGSMTAPGIVLTLVTALGAAAWWRRGRRFVVFYVAFSLVMTALLEVPQTRYFVPLLPLLFLFAIDGVLAAANLAVAVASRIGAGPAAAARGTAVAGAAALLALTLSINGRAIAGVFMPRFADEYYRSYQKGEYYDYLALARDLASNPPPGAVMASEYRVIHALSRASACRPFDGYWTGRVDEDRAARYVIDNSVAAILIDPRHDLCAELFSDYVARHPSSWRLSATYGTLSLYSRVP